MAAPLSVIIPTLNAAPTIGPTLASIIEGVKCELVREVVIADGGSADGIGRVADETGAVFLTCKPGRGSQMRAGASVARADWLLFIHADTVLEAGWTDAVVRHLDHPDAAGYFRLAFDEAGMFPTLTARWANLRSLLFRLPYGDQCLLVHRSLYAAVDGHPDQPIMEDVDLNRRLGNRLVALSAVATTSAARYRRDGWLRRGSRNLLTLALHFLGSDPKTLASFYAGNPAENAKRD